MKTSHQIREAFLQHFKERGHTRLPSGPLVPPNDPTLMFANAGMVQFKDVFTGKDKRPYTRATTSQKCIRISGKHNDLENVGFTARHHTFFEMLGNFSFGDYFKRDAIRFAWEFIEACELPKEKLCVTVFEGEGNLPADDEAAAIWAEVTGFPPERIIRCGAADNFWSMGDTGPCGPCTEIHFWMGESAPDLSKFGQEPGPDGAGWVEIWNNVFMQFERHKDGRLEPLPAQSVDTGMGLERITCAVQGVVSNYDTDLLRPIVKKAAQISGKEYRGTLEKDDVSMRVIADHARTAAFLIAEGIFPDKEGRSYVLRRVMRRAIRHGHRLGIEKPFLHECALVAVELLGGSYPELVERRALIAEVVQNEEERFRATMKRGLELLEQNQSWDEVEGQRALPGSVAFKLYDTFGFPLDLQEVIGQEQGFTVDRKGFDVQLEVAREKSSSSQLHKDKAVSEVHHALARELGATEFSGYERERASGTIAALVRDGERVPSLARGERGEILLTSTPFYAEGGGQVGDRGVIRGGDSVFQVEDTQKPVGGLFVHRGHVEEGQLEVGQTVELEVDHELRSATRRNHSATHLLHWALRTVLGPTALQKGSLVSPDRLRFDYAGTKPLSLEELRRIEDLVNRKVLENAPIETEVLPMAEAKAKGAIGIFEEKYGEVVRMLRMTSESIELCGGTHASRTGDIGLFKIISEGGVAAGVRRIEAVTGGGALRWTRELERELMETAGLLRGSPMQAKEKVEKLLAQQRELQREIERLQQKLVHGGGGGGDLTAEAKEIAGVRVLGTTVELGDGKALRELADQLRDKLAPAVILLGSATKDGKAILACSVSKDVTDRWKAGDIIKDAAAIVGGGGGGRPDFAQAGGSDPTKLSEAVQRVYALVH